MAKTTVITDDIDGSSGAEEITFSFDGSSYTIDLAKKNRAAFEKALKPYIEAATKTSGRGVRSTTRTRKPAAAKRDLAAIRAWAAENGFEVSNRGRIPGTVIEAYEAAH